MRWVDDPTGFDDLGDFDRYNFQENEIVMCIEWCLEESLAMPYWIHRGGSRESRTGLLVHTTKGSFRVLTLNRLRRTEVHKNGATFDHGLAA